MGYKKSRIESDHFIVFRSLAQDFPAGEVWHDDSPDFLIHTEGGIIGVEHCLVHVPTKQRVLLQAIESQTDEIISIAQEHAELRGTPSVHVSILFGNVPKMHKAERVEMARNIARVVHEELERMNVTEPFRHKVIRQPEQLEHVSMINMIAVPEGLRHYWRCARAGWAVENCIQAFTVTVSKKEEIIDSYFMKCSTCWLLMVGGPKPSGFLHPDTATINHIFKSRFERIYYMDMSQRKLHSLRIRGAI